MDAMVRREEFGPVDRDFGHLFSSWFNRGVLVLRRIDWSTPASVLEKIIRYEAGPRHQGLERPARPRGFAGPALLRLLPSRTGGRAADLRGSGPHQGRAGRIAPILDQSRTTIAAETANTAVFYSISNCQRGLAGVSFGHFLIKQVAEEISREIPSLSTFVTLSPVPGFGAFLKAQRKTEPNPLLTPPTSRPSPCWTSPAGRRRKRPAPRSRRSSARWPRIIFWWRNHPRGARLIRSRGSIWAMARGWKRINPMGDLSPKGIAQAAGLMVNYRYVLSDIEKNHEAFAGKGEIVASPAVKKLLRGDASARALVRRND